MLHGITSAHHSYTRVMFWQEAEQLENGPSAPSVKQAIWNAALSAAFDLETNCKLADVMRQYVWSGPPKDRQTLVDELCCVHGQAGRPNYANAIYRAQELEDAGLLNQFLIFPDNLPGQRAWRDSLLILMGGHGMSYKTASMVALILYPTRSHLVPVDKHVIERFELGLDGSPQSKTGYERVEDMVLAEREEIAEIVDSVGINGLEAHWITWMWRREENAAKNRDKKIHGEDHLRLSARRYPLLVRSDLQNHK